MSSETSTRRAMRRNSDHVGDEVRPKPASTQGDDGAADATGVRPWHLFVIATLLASSAAAVAVRGTTPTNVIFVCITVMMAGLAAYLVYRTLSPLVEPDVIEVPEMLGGRTRAALEREKTLVLRAIKELEFDRAMGKVSEADWQEMTARLRARAVRLIRQLDSGSAAYRDIIEKELAARRASSAAGSAPNGGRASATGAAILLALGIGAFPAVSPAWAQMAGSGMAGAGMPDAKAMSGIPRPSDTVPTGSVSVRLVRGQLSNNITDHPVDFLVDGKRQTVKTGPTGHAVLGGLAAGATVQAKTTVDGEALQSQPFQVPAQGGTVLMLVATDRTAQQQMAKAAVPGTVVLGSQSRVILQFDEEILQAFYLLDIVNGGAAPVKTPGPLVFEMPGDALNTTVLEGSSPAASAKGRRVTVNGPFPPGATSVQIGFQLPPDDSANVRLDLPVDYLQPTVIVEKAGGTMTVESSQLSSRQEASDNGKLFVVAAGPPLKAGQAFAFTVTGVPHHSPWPRNVALALAVILLTAGAWVALGPQGRSGASAARKELEKRREAIFAELLRLDRRQGGEADPQHDERRRALVAELENIYGELDAETPGRRQEQGLPA